MSIRMNDLLYEKLTIINWNIGNPSIDRAGRQAKWLIKKDADVIVLTECKNSNGCNLIENNLKLLGYHIYFDKPKKKEYGVIIASKYPFRNSPVSEHVKYLPNRIAAIVIGDDLELIATYIPSRGYELSKKERKKIFINTLLSAIEKHSKYNKRIFCGDFNILEPNHVPRYAVFEKWEYDFYEALGKQNLVDAFRMLYHDINEYSWIGRNGNGYRYDHCFISLELLQYLDNCYYLHEPRELALSDHSAQLIVLTK